jgi:hypothetical protein
MSEKKIKELIKSEMCRGENEKEVTNLLVQILTEYANNNPKIGHVELESKLKEFLDPHPSYFHDFTSIIELVREATLDEEKLTEEKTILTAKTACLLRKQFITEMDNIEKSGLSDIKKHAMSEIRTAVMKGSEYVRIHFEYDNGTPKDYEEKIALKKWLEKLGYNIDYYGYGKYMIWF